mmetsp:Transcript_28298/g.63388  ORF Transcript_28298/g.63388 Transcript_28298/m.63388 type:complete len:124 (-) Transcript_28298:96-467(-)
MDGLMVERSFPTTFNPGIDIFGSLDMLVLAAFILSISMLSSMLEAGSDRSRLTAVVAVVPATLIASRREMWASSHRDSASPTEQAKRKTNRLAPAVMNPAGFIGFECGSEIHGTSQSTVAPIS